MLTGPAPSANKVLKRCGMSKDDIDQFELNEAVAVVVLHYMKEMGIEHDEINVNGGAIAMGHPLGATGGMVLGTLIDEIERRDLSTGLVNLCIAMHKFTNPVLRSLLSISSISVPKTIPPVAPSGCPIAIAPPLTLISSCSIPISFM